MSGELVQADRQIGLVAIGRNEGERLRTCLVSVVGKVGCVVYVDSGSTDGSVELAESMGVHVVNLDMTRPFTAAPARNEGFAALMKLMPEAKYVQFVDGDCEVVSGWLDIALEFLQTNAKVAAVCGRRRERFPNRSIYNALCDAEWDTPIGQTRSCGGDVMMRTDALRGVNGYRSDLIAGEEPELCVRLRQAGWQIWRLGEEMTLHDANIVRFGQWWKRAMRGGYAFAQGAFLHGAPPESHCVTPVRRLWAWGLGLPMLIVFGFLFTPWAVLILLAYPLQMLRLASRDQDLRTGRWHRAFFLVASKFPEMIGALKFTFNRCSGKSGTLIEYK